jgi:hypothetical protein
VANRGREVNAEILVPKANEVVKAKREMMESVDIRARTELPE